MAPVFVWLVARTLKVGSKSTTAESGAQYVMTTSTTPTHQLSATVLASGQWLRRLLSDVINSMDEVLSLTVCGLARMLEKI